MSEDMTPAGKFLYTKNAAKQVWEKRDPVSRNVVGTLPLNAASTSWCVGSSGVNGGNHLPVLAGSGTTQVQETKRSTFEKAETVKDCAHDGTKLVWEYDGRKFFCAGFGGVKPANYDLTIDL